MGTKSGGGAPTTVSWKAPTFLEADKSISEGVSGLQERGEDTAYDLEMLPTGSLATKQRRQR